MSSLAAFFEKLPQKTYKKGDIIIQPDQALDSIYYITHGQVRMLLISPEGKELSLHIFQPLSLFPLMLTLSGTPNKYYFEALSSVSVHVASESAVVDFLKNNPSEAFMLLERFSKAIMGLVLRIENLTHASTSIQISSLLEHLHSRFPHQKITHHELAKWLGLSRETVSRRYQKSSPPKLETSS